MGSGRKAVNIWACGSILTGGSVMEMPRERHHDGRLKENLIMERMPLMDSFNQFFCGNTASRLAVCNCGMQWEKR